jgi:hypothetical protein
MVLESAPFSHFNSKVFTARLVYSLLFLVVLQTTFVFLPSGMCSIVETVPPSPARINFITPRDGALDIGYSLGNSGGSPYTGLDYSTDNGDTWAPFVTNPAKKGVDTIFTKSDGSPLVNDEKVVVTVRPKTEAYPNVEDNVASQAPEYAATPSDAPQPATAPTMNSWSKPDQNQIGVVFTLNSPGNTQFKDVYFSTDNGATWANTNLQGPDFGTSDASQFETSFVITSLSSDVSISLSPSTNYLVKIAVTTVADNVTKLSSNMLSTNTLPALDPGEEPVPDPPGPPADFSSEPTANENCVKVNFSVPTYTGSQNLDSFWVKINDEDNFNKVSDDINGGFVLVCGLEPGLPINLESVWANKDQPDPNLIAPENLNTAKNSAVPAILPPNLKADPPSINDIFPLPNKLKVFYTLNNRGTGLFNTLYYRLGTGSWVDSGVTDFSDLSSNFFILGLTNGTTYSVTLRVTTTGFEDVNDAETSNAKTGTPAASSIRPSKPVITDVIERVVYDSFLSVNYIEFQFRISLGSNGGSEFTNVYYTTNGGTSFLPLNIAENGTVNIRTESTEDIGAGLTDLMDGVTYPVQIVSSTIAFPYDYTTGNTKSDVFNMKYDGTTTAPDAPVLNEIRELNNGNVEIYFTLLGYNDIGGVQLYYTSNSGADEMYLQLGGTNPSSPIEISYDSLGNPFSIGTYNFKLALVNSATLTPESSPKSSSTEFSYVNPIAISRRELMSNPTILTATLGDEICLHDDWKKYQTWMNSVSFGLALGLPSLLLWKVKVVPWYPIGLAIFFWIFSHALRDFRDKSVTTEYKVAARWLLYTEKLCKWLSFGFLISAPIAVYSYNTYGKQELFEMYLENKNYKNNSKTVGVFH